MMTRLQEFKGLLKKLEKIIPILNENKSHTPIQEDLDFHHIMVRILQLLLRSKTWEEGMEMECELVSLLNVKLKDHYGWRDCWIYLIYNDLPFHLLPREENV